MIPTLRGGEALSQALPRGARVLGVVHQQPAGRVCVPLEQLKLENSAWLGHDQRSRARTSNHLGELWWPSINFRMPLVPEEFLVHSPQVL